MSDGQDSAEPRAVDDLPRDEAARLVQASLRPSRFLLVIQREDREREIRNYGVDHPDTVPLVEHELVESALLDIEASYYGTLERDKMMAMVASMLGLLLPGGGVICVPPPDHLLCTRCRVGLRAHRTPDDQELCYSCATAFTQMTGVRTVEIGNESLGSGNV